MYQNDYIAKKMMTQKFDEYVRQAEQDRLIERLNAERPNRILEFARGAGLAVGQSLSAARGRLGRIQVPQAQVRVNRIATGK